MKTLVNRDFFNRGQQKKLKSNALNLKVNSVYHLEPKDFDKDLKSKLDKGDVFSFPFKLKTYAIPSHPNRKRSLLPFKDISMKQLLGNRSFVKSIKGLELKRDPSTV